MNKKSAILFFSALVLLSLGVLYVFGDLMIHGDVSGTTTATTDDPSPWIKGGDSKLLNITIGHSLTTANNITNFTLELNASDATGWGNFTSWSFLHEPFGIAGNKSDGSGEDGNLTNVTYGNFDDVFGGNMALGGWDCWNTTELIIYCEALNNESYLQPGRNTTATVVINITGASTSDEALFTIDITATDAEDLSGDNIGAGNTTNVTAYVDDQYPRLIEVNISDGNTTYANSTWGSTYYLNGPLVISALIEDAQLEGGTTGSTGGVVLGYNCNATNGSFNQEAQGGWYAEQARPVTNSSIGIIDGRGSITSTSINCYTLYNTNDPISNANETFSFAFLANDSFNHRIMLNTTGFSDFNPFNITFDDGDILPTIANVNVTQTVMTTSDGSGTSSVSKTLTHGSGLDGANDYLAANTLTFDIGITGGSKPYSVLIYWNDTDTASGVTALAPAVIGDTGAVFPAIANLDETMALNATNSTGPGAALVGAGDGVGYATGTVYRATLDLNNNNSHYFAFWVVANNSGQNYTRLSGPHRFQVDGLAPSITMTPPTDLTITPKASITYKCTISDALSGNNKIMWQLKKPGETAFTTKQSYEDVDTNNADSITFTGDDTNLAGDYDVKCLAIDNIGNEGTYTTSSSEIFSVHYSTTEVGVAEGAAAAADIDLSTQEEITITEKQGVISTFTLDGTTVHTIKIKTVDEVAGTVTIVIESNPIEITLKIGETKEVDVDADGANDISVTLNKITDGAADITTKRLAPLPEKEVPTEEVPPTEKPTEEITPEAAPSKTWLWILIIVIIVVIGVGYWFMKRK